MGLNDLYEFDLVAEDGTISTENWPRAWHLLVHLQPAKRADLVGDPPRAIHVQGFGGTVVAPGLLAELETLAGTKLRVVPRAE